MAEIAKLVEIPNEATYGTFRRVLSTKANPVVSHRLYEDPDGDQYFRLGSCNGPKVVIRKSKRVKWLRRAPATAANRDTFLSNKEYENLKGSPDQGYLFSDPDKADLDPGYLSRFRRGGCGLIFYVSCDELYDPEDYPDDPLRVAVKGAVCARCGSIASFHGVKPKGATLSAE